MKPNNTKLHMLSLDTRDTGNQTHPLLRRPRAASSVASLAGCPLPLAACSLEAAARRSIEAAARRTPPSPLAHRAPDSALASRRSKLQHAA